MDEENNPPENKKNKSEVKSEESANLDKSVKDDNKSDQASEVQKEEETKNNEISKKE